MRTYICYNTYLYCKIIKRKFSLNWKLELSRKESFDLLKIYYQIKICFNTCSHLRSDLLLSLYMLYTTRIKEKRWLSDQYIRVYTLCKDVIDLHSIIKNTFDMSSLRNFNFIMSKPLLQQYLYLRQSEYQSQKNVLVYNIFRFDMPKNIIHRKHYLVHGNILTCVFSTSA